MVKDLVKIVLGSSEGRLLPVHAITSCWHCGHCCRFLPKWQRSSPRAARRQVVRAVVMTRYTLALRGFALEEMFASVDDAVE